MAKETWPNELSSQKSEQISIYKVFVLQICCHSTLLESLDERWPCVVKQVKLRTDKYALTVVPFSFEMSVFV